MARSIVDDFPAQLQGSPNHPRTEGRRYLTSAGMMSEGIRALNETGPALDRYNHSAQVPARTISAHLRSIWGHHILDPTLMPVLPAESDQDVYG